MHIPGIGGGGGRGVLPAGPRLVERRQPTQGRFGIRVSGLKVSPRRPFRVSGSGVEPEFGS